MLHRRRRRSPSPATHYRALVSSIFSSKGILFLVLYPFVAALAALAAVAYIPWFQYVSLIFLYVGSTRLAWRAMSMRGNSIDFPQVSVDEMLSFHIVFPIVVFSMLFIKAPILLVGLGLVTKVIPLPAAALAAMLLLAYASMALVGFLRTNTVMGMFDFTQSVRLIKEDPRGYAFLSTVIFAAFGMRLIFNTVIVHMGLTSVVLLNFVLAPVEAVVVLFVFGMCGLYVRSKARSLDLPCDEDDWQALGPPPEIKESSGHTPSSSQEQAQAQSEVPLVTGVLPLAQGAQVAATPVIPSIAPMPIPLPQPEAEAVTPPAVVGQLIEVPTQDGTAAPLPTPVPLNQAAPGFDRQPSAPRDNTILSEALVPDGPDTTGEAKPLLLVGTLVEDPKLDK